MGIRDRLPPALVLFLLSPVVGELLSGSSPPSEFFTLFGFTIMSLLYGGGAIVCRELKVRWGKGMGSLVLLGAAYGVVEEGLMVASFQNPNWMDLGVLGTFGRIWGVNWVWTVELTAYHAFVSITVPIILVELLYPERKTESWLRGIWRKIVPALFILDVVGGYYLFALVSGFWSPVPPYIFFILVTCLLTLAAYRLPPDWARRGQKAMSHPRRVLLIAFAAAFSCGFVFWILPNNLTGPLSAMLVIFLGLAVILLTIRQLTGYNWNNANPVHRLALTAGSLSPLMLSAIFQEIDGNRPDDTTGMATVGILFIVAHVLLWRNLRKTDRAI